MMFALRRPFSEIFVHLVERNNQVLTEPSFILIQAYQLDDNDKKLTTFYVVIIIRAIIFISHTILS